jgi:hypothetical protein
VKTAKRAHFGEEACKEWLNQPPIQFPLHPYSPIMDDFNKSIYSQVGNGVNQIKVCMDDYLRDTISMETMLLVAFQNDELGDDAHITDTFFERMKSSSTTPLFGPIW